VASPYLMSVGTSGRSLPHVVPYRVAIDDTRRRNKVAGSLPVALRSGIMMSSLYEGSAKKLSKADGFDYLRSLGSECHEFTYNDAKIKIRISPKRHMIAFTSSFGRGSGCRWLLEGTF
jgi:hypothetical protein